jgi:16S rRNA (adenine1518-N6/adenine1519-N6)-dimethyltransferase
VRSKLGQHFLIDRRIIHRILATAQVTPPDWVVEIGPGQGSLTTALAQQAQRLFAVEYDAALLANLQQTFAGQPHVQVVQADARTINYAELLAEAQASQARVKIVANLPYYAAVPILLAIFEAAHLFQTATLMFQKEVAERLTASPGTKAYGTLSLAARYYSQPEYCFTIAAHAFRPRPQAESAVVKLTFLPHPPVEVDDRDYFFQVVQYAFRSRRKTLKNSLHKNCAALFPLNLLDMAFEHLHWSEHVRGEELTLADFAALSNFLRRNQAASEE